MIKRSKSIIAITGVGLAVLIAVIVGAVVLGSPQRTAFAEDGYILTAEVDESTESGTLSTKLWFSGGSRYSSSGSSISFVSSEGSQIEADADSFVHYESGTVTTVTESSVMDLDDFASGIISYYTMEPGDNLYMEGGFYYLGQDTESSDSFENFLAKNSDTRYMLGSPMLTLMRASGQGGESIDAGFVEIEYLASDKSVALLNDGVNAWQFLTQDCYIEFYNGVRLDLASGELYYPLETADEESGTEALTYSLAIDDIEIGTGSATATVGDVSTNASQDGSGYPVYRFTVINGADGESGSDGEDGEEGAEGEEGVLGQTGVTPGEGEEGEAGADGATGEAGVNGAAGGTMSGVKVATTIPVVTLTEWSVNGQTLSFTASMSEESEDSVVDGTTVITLTDLDSGEVIYWSASADDDAEDYGSEYDFAANNGQVSISTSKLTPGHEYRLTITLTYTLDDEEEVTADILTRVFTADDYGLSFDLVDRTTSTLTFSLDSSNRNVDVEYVSVYVNGVWVYDASPQEFEDGYVLDLWSLNVVDGYGEAEDYANQSWTVTFKPVFNVTTYTADGEYTTTTWGDTEATEVSYEYIISTLKKAPTLGGVRLTAYNSGYLMAEVLGAYNSGSGSYDAVEDEDDTISSVLFKLYGSYADMEADTNAVATKTVTTGYVGYFQVSEDANEAVHTEKTYYLRAWYTWSDGSVVTESIVYSSSDSPDTVESEDDGDSSVHKCAGDYAADKNSLLAITKQQLSFEGDCTIWNTVDDYAADVADRIDDDGSQNASGITFNEISGKIVASVSLSNSYVVSPDYPLELQISGEPDYYNVVTFNEIESYVDATATMGYDSTLASGSTPTELKNFTELDLAVDLTGLKADTSYMFTLYGYTKSDDNTYTRVTLGSLSLTTAQEPGIEVNVMTTQEVATDTGIGFAFYIGASDATNYYDSNYAYYEDDDYLQDTDASYRSLYSLTFYLYSADSSTPIGYYTFTDDYTNVAGRSSLYEDFYGETGSDGVESLVQSLSAYGGVVGVGTSYTNRFVDFNGKTISESALSSGNYYAVAVLAYDYTEYRYETMTAGTSTLYDYYAWTSAEAKYVNELTISGNKTSNTVALTSLPYTSLTEAAYTDSDTKELYYIEVEELLNSELGDYDYYSGDDNDDEDLYSDFWDADTVAGLKLSCGYQGDSVSGTFPTTSFTYYVYDLATWETMVSAEQDISTDATVKDSYVTSFTLEMYTNNWSSPPEVWLLFYNEDDLPMVSGNAVEVNDITGVDYMRDLDTNGDGIVDIIIYYMNAEVFSRGHSYIFRYEATIDGYKTGATSYSSDNGTFYYPQTIYEEADTKYTAANALASQTISVYRQTPEIYSWLEETSTDESTGVRSDSWQIYVSDPDGALDWKTMLGTGDDDARYANTSAGILNLLGSSASDSTLSGLTFTLKSLTSSGSSYREGSYALTTSTGYYGTEADTGEQLSSELNDTELGYIAEAMTYRKMNDMEVESYGLGSGALTVSGLSASGGSYQMLLDYRLLDDEGSVAGTAWTSVALVQHLYIAKMDADTLAAQITLSEPDIQDDQDTVRIYLQASGASSTTDTAYSGSDYLNAVNAISAVQLTAHVKNGTGYDDIYERDANGEVDHTTVKTLTLIPNAPEDTGATTTDCRYYLEFLLSDLDDAEDATLQFDAGDTLSFELNVYYLTGASYNYTAAGSYLTTTSGGSYFALKHVNSFEYQSSLYGVSGYSQLLAKYAYSSNNTRYTSYGSAGGSLFQIDSTFSISTLPWTQTLKAYSAPADASFTGTGLLATKGLETTLSSSGGYAEAYVFELMVTATSMSFGAQEAYDYYAASLTVPSAVPSLSDGAALGGVVTLELTGTVKNWNRVDYGSESFHLYYLIYDYTNGTPGDLVAVQVGNALTSSSLDVSFAPLATGGDYWIEVYYKQSGDTTDENLFSGYDADSETYGQGQTILVTANKTLAEAIETAVTTTTYNDGTEDVNLFTSPVGSDGYAVSTSEGLTFSSLTLTLGKEKAYSSKSLTVAAGIDSSQLVSSEQQYFAIYYRLERMAEDETEWTTVLAESDDPEYGGTSLGSPATWADSGVTYSKSDGVSTTNSLTFSYAAGNGIIVPGYSYRVLACVYRTDTEESVMATGADLYSAEEAWSSLSLENNASALVETTSATRTSSSFSLYYVLKDVNYTSVDGYYLTRLAEYDSTNDSWTVLEDTDCYGSNELNNVRTMGVTQSGSYTNLTAGGTYRLQFYALMDIDYDGYLNYQASDDDWPLMSDDSSYLLTNSSDLSTAKANYLNATGEISDWSVLGSDNTKHAAILVGWSSEIELLSSSVTITAGESIQSVTVDSASQITVRFSGGAMKADEVETLSYMITYTDANSNVTTWPEVSLHKGSDETSLFSSVSTSNDHAGVSGVVYLPIDLTDGGELVSYPDMTSAGKYKIVIYLYDEEGNQLSTSYSKSFIVTN
ncbi:MAG: hypothetical protein LUE24_14780 [Lachnospiraceae bacterium]|nr:hypothetical protein [Lachnospiraceae bacterium]